MLLLAPFAAEGRFYKGNLHTHSTASDAVRDPDQVCAMYREAGYDFLSLTDHFLPKFNFPITDTRPFRTNNFTTILGAEVHAPKTELGEIWHILSVGLPRDFAPTTPTETGPELAARAAALGAYFSVSGIATFKAADDVRALIRDMPADRILVETDCPYLAPVPHRGRRNEPAYIPHILANLAEIRGWSLAEAEARTTDAFFDLFTAIPRPS